MLFWNLIQPAQGCCNKTYFAQLLPSASIEDIEVEISELKISAQYSVCVETIGYRLGDAYNAYLDGKFTDLPTREETIQLIEQSKPKKTPAK